MPAGLLEAALEGAVRRLRPIMMTMLVTTLGMLPDALSHAIGSDSQLPSAIGAPYRPASVARVGAASLSAEALVAGGCEFII